MSKAQSKSKLSDAENAVRGAVTTAETDAVIKTTISDLFRGLTECHSTEENFASIQKMQELLTDKLTAMNARDLDIDNENIELIRNNIDITREKNTLITQFNRYISEVSRCVLYDT